MPLTEIVEYVSATLYEAFASFMFVENGDVTVILTDGKNSFRFVVKE
jgi:hypothetical protein